MRDGVPESGALAADIAGGSHGRVSFVISGSGRISPRRRARVVLARRVGQTGLPWGAMAGRIAPLASRDLNAGLLHAWLGRAVQRLSEQEAAINALNVFPVPDGDTGTNLLLTLRAAVAGLEAVPDGEPLSVAVQRMARGALLGARGNSGVILSQQLRGLRLPPRTVPRGAQAIASRHLVAILESMAHAGRLAVAHPMEGTMLTVMSDAATAAALSDPDDLTAVVCAAAAGARTSLLRTPELLPALADAGVVDSGGAGIVALLDALEELVTGQSVEPPAVLSAQARAVVTTCEDEGIEVMAVVRMGEAKAVQLRDALVACGTSVAIVGDDDLWHAHVHVAHMSDVDVVIESCRQLGVIEQVRTMDLTVSPAHQIRDTVEHTRVVVVGVLGEGLAAFVRAAGGVALTPTEGLRPSVRDVMDVLMRAHDGGAEEMIILPSDRDSLAATHEAVRQFDRHRTRDVAVAVVPTESVVQSLAALAVHEPNRGFAATLSAMDEAASDTVYAGVTRASRAGMHAGMRVEAGQVIGVVQGDVMIVGDDITQVGVDVLAHLLSDDTEIVTVIAGSGFPAARVADVVAAVADRHPDLEVEVIEGGQPAWPLIMGVT